MKRILFSIVYLFLIGIVSAQQKQLYILQTSDTHSRIEPIKPNAADRNAGMGGVVRRATYIKQMREQHPQLLLLDCGDISQGTPYYNMFQGELEVKMMNLMKYDAMTIGNHEFDFGLENLARLFRLAEFPIVCANYDVSGTILEGLVQPYVVIEREGIRIGIFGLSPRLEGLVQTDNCAGIAYKDPIETAQQVTDCLRMKEACDVVICLSHLGFNTKDSDGHYDESLLNRTQGIDLVLGGHTHTFMENAANYLNAAGKEVPLLHSGSKGCYIGEVILTLSED